MSVILSEDDLAVGDFITIHSIKNHPRRVVDIMGCPLKILGICFPYVAVSPVVGHPPNPWTMDCRRINFMRLTPEYVDAIKEFALAVPKEANAEHSRIPEEQDAGQPE
jgi:hypothetical protein